MYTTRLTQLLNPGPDEETQLDHFVGQNQTPGPDEAIDVFERLALTTSILEGYFLSRRFPTPVNLVLATSSDLKVQQAIRMLEGSDVEFSVTPMPVQEEITQGSCAERAVSKARSLDGVAEGPPTIYLGEEFMITLPNLDDWPGHETGKTVELLGPEGARRNMLERLLAAGYDSVDGAARDKRKAIQTNGVALYDPKTYRIRYAQNEITCWVPLKEMGESEHPFDAIMVPSDADQTIIIPERYRDKSLAQWDLEARQETGRGLWHQVKNLVLAIYIANNPEPLEES